MMFIAGGIVLDFGNMSTNISNTPCNKVFVVVFGNLFDFLLKNCLLNFFIDSKILKVPVTLKMIDDLKGIDFYRPFCAFHDK